MRNQLARPVEGIHARGDFDAHLALCGTDADDYAEYLAWKQRRQRLRPVQDMPVSQAIARYRCDHLSQLAKSTQVTYDPIITHHEAWLLQEFGRDPMVSELNRVTIERYVQGRRQRKAKPKAASISEETSAAYRSQILGCLKGFYKYLFQSDIVEKDPCRDVKVPFSRGTIRNHLTLDEAMLLLQLAATKRRYRLRDLTLVVFMLWTGARIEEVTRTQVGHVDFATASIRLFGKGSRGEKKVRSVPMPDELRDTLRDWLIRGHGLTADGDQLKGPPGWQNRALFFAPRSDRPFLSVRNLRSTLTRLLIRLQLQLEPGRMDPEEVRKRSRSGSRIPVPRELRQERRYFTPHSLRHTFAFLALSAGIDLRTIQLWMGHCDLRTTSIYLNLTQEEQRERMKLHPLANVSLAKLREGLR